MEGNSGNNSPVREQSLSPVLNRKRFSRRQFLSQSTKQKPYPDGSPRNGDKRTSSIPVPIVQKVKSPTVKLTNSDTNISHCNAFNNKLPKRETVVLYGSRKQLISGNESKIKNRSCFIIGEEINTVCEKRHYLMEPRCTRTCSSDSIESPRNQVDLSVIAQSKLNVSNKSQLNYNIGTDESNFTLEGEIEELEKQFAMRQNTNDYNISTQETNTLFSDVSQFLGRAFEDSCEDLKGVNSKDVINVDISDSVFNTLTEINTLKFEEDFHGFGEYDVDETVDELEKYQMFLSMFNSGLERSNLSPLDSAVSVVDSSSGKKLKKSCLNDEGYELVRKETEEKKNVGVKRSRRDSWDEGDVKTKGVKQNKVNLRQAIEEIKMRLEAELSEDDDVESNSEKSERNRVQSKNKFEEERKKNNNSPIVDENIPHCSQNTVSIKQIVHKELINFNEQVALVKNEEGNSFHSHENSTEHQLIQLKHKEENYLHSNQNSENSNQTLAVQHLTHYKDKEEISSHKYLRQNLSPSRNKEENTFASFPRKSIDYSHSSSSKKSHKSESCKKGKSLKKIPKNKDLKTSSENQKLKNNTEVSSPVKSPENPNVISLPSSNGVQICIGNNRIKINIRTTECDRKTNDGNVGIIEGSNELKRDDLNLKNCAKLGNENMIESNCRSLKSKTKHASTLESGLNKLESEHVGLKRENVSSPSQVTELRKGACKHDLIEKSSNICSDFLNDSFTIPSQFLNDAKLEEMVGIETSPGTSVSKEQMVKPTKKMFDEKSENNENLEHTDLAFSTASGKKIEVSEARIKNAVKFFKDVLSAEKTKTDFDFTDSFSKNDESSKFTSPKSNSQTNNDESLENDSDFKFKLPSRISDYNKGKSDLSELTLETLKMVECFENDMKKYCLKPLLHGMSNKGRALSPQPFNLRLCSKPNNLSLQQENSLLSSFGDLAGGSSPQQRRFLKPKSLLKPRPEYGRPSCLQSGSRKSLNFHSCSGDTGLYMEEIANVRTGFSSASGNVVEISKEKLKRAMNLFIGIEKDVSALIESTNGKENNSMNENQLRSNENHNQSPPNVVNENRPRFNKNPSRSNENQSSTNENQSRSTENQSRFNVINVLLSSGKKIGITEKQMQRAKMIYGDDLDLNQELGSGSSKMKKSSMETGGFKNASTAAVKTGNQNLTQVCNDLNQNKAGTSKENYRVASGSQNKAGTSNENSASGNQISNENNAGSSLASGSQNSKEKNKAGISVASGNQNSKRNDNVGFSSTSGSGLNSSKVANGSCKGDLQSKKIGVANEENASTGFGFSLASGKKVELSKDQLNKAKNIFGDDLNIKETLDDDFDKEFADFQLSFSQQNKLKSEEDKLKLIDEGLQEGFSDTKAIISNENEQTLNKSALENLNIKSTGENKTSKIKDGSFSEQNKRICERVGTSFDECNQEPGFSGGLGFSSASGKKIEISKDRLKNAMKCFDEDLVMNEEQPTDFAFSSSENDIGFSKPNKQPGKTDEKHSNEQFVKQLAVGFSLASGKKLDFAREGLKKAMELFGDDLNMKEVDAEKQLEFIEEGASGFSPVVTQTKFTQDDDCGTIENTPHSGFSLSSGKVLPLQSQKSSLSGNVLPPQSSSGKNLPLQLGFSSSSEKFLQHNEMVEKSTFSLALGKTVLIPKEKIKEAMEIFSQELYSGASGKNVKIPKEKIAMAINLCKDIDKGLDELKKSFENDFDENELKKVEANTPSMNERKSFKDNQLKKELFPDLHEESFNERFFAEEFSQEVKKARNVNEQHFPLNNNTENDVNKTIPASLQERHFRNETKIVNNKNLNKSTSEILNEMNDSRSDVLENNILNQTTPADKNLKKSVPEILEDAVCAYNTAMEKCSSPKICHTPDRKPLKKQLGILGKHKPINVSKEGLERGKEVFKDLELNFPNSPIRNNDAPQCSTPKIKGCSRAMESFNLTPIKATQNVKKFEPIVDSGDSTIIFHEKSCGGFKQMLSDIDKEYEVIKRKLVVLEERKNELEQQKALIESGPEAHKRPKTGVLLENKLDCEERVPLKNLFNSGDESVDYFNIPQYIFDVSPKNAEDVHFNVASGNEYLSIIKTSEGSVIIPSSSNIVGLTEIDNAFRALVGVDPKLLHQEWVQNHYKWIVWKLASYERKFPQYFKYCLSVENVMQQLKYRYDVEIDRSKRSALRKIFEKDDVPQKRIVLCVSDITQQLGNKLELELTDGWYSVKTIIDQPLSQQIHKNKIKVGTKLIIQGAELINCEHGTHPLDAGDSVRLKIYFNGTRRAHWYTKLGYYKFAAPFPVYMSSLSAEGGPVSFIKIYIARAYPLNYIEKLNNAKIWRNCKAEEKRATEFESERMKQIELIKEKACREYENKKHHSVYNSNSANITKTEISNISCPKTLYNLIQRSGDPESLIELLTSSQQRSVMEYKQNLNNQKQHEISMKVNKQIDELKLNKRDVVPVLKLLVMDACEGSDKHFTFTVWSPSEDHLHMLKEDTSFSVHNVTFGKTGELYSSNRTYFRLNTEPVKLKKPSRQLLPIAMTVDNYYKPLFGEFDTIGLIVRMHIENYQQELWVADFNERLLFVRIVNGSPLCCLLENLKKGQTVAICNLIKKASKGEFGIAIANFCTVISQYPSQKYLQKGMQLFKKQLPKDLSKLITDCDAKIAHYRKAASLSFIRNSFLKNNKSTCDDNENMEDSTTIPSTMTMTDVAMSLIDTDQFA